MLCTSCNTEKDITEFYSSHVTCIPCYREKQYKYRITNPKHRMLDSAKARAKADNGPFDLRLEDFEIPTLCPVLGIRLEIGSGIGGCGDHSPSLDKVIPQLGYVRGNVSVISNRANRLKNDSTLEEMEKMLIWMRDAVHTSKTTVGIFPPRLDKPKHVWVRLGDKEQRILEGHVGGFLNNGWERGRSLSYQRIKKVA